MLISLWISFYSSVLSWSTYVFVASFHNAAATFLKSWLVYFLNEVSLSMLVHTQGELFNSARLASCTVTNMGFAVLVPPLSPSFFFHFLTKSFKWRECHYNKLAKLQVLQKVDQRKPSPTLWLCGFAKHFVIVCWIMCFGKPLNQAFVWLPAFAAVTACFFFLLRWWTLVWLQ